MISEAVPKRDLSTETNMKSGSVCVCVCARACVCVCVCVCVYIHECVRACMHVYVCTACIRIICVYCSILYNKFDLQTMFCHMTFM